MNKLDYFVRKVEEHEVKIERLEAKIGAQEQLIRSNKCNRREGESKVFMPRTCHEARNADPSLASGLHWIDPDGVNVGDGPIQVYCDMLTGIYEIKESFKPLFLIRIGMCI